MLTVKPTFRVSTGALAVVAAIGVVSVSSSHAAGGCTTQSKDVIVCPVATGLSTVEATEYSTGLDDASGMSVVDVINVLRPCRTLRLYYIFGFMGQSGDVPPVTLRIGQAAVYGSRWLVSNSSKLTGEIQSQLTQESRNSPTYSLPYPSSYWYVYVAHSDQLYLSLGGVICTRS